LLQSSEEACIVTARVARVSVRRRGEADRGRNAEYRK
jgi:hypothetical protein